MRVLFLGTPEFAVPSLEQIAKDSDLELIGVVTQPDRPAGRKMRLQPSAVRARAEELGLPVWPIDNVNTRDFRAHVKSLKVEAAVVVAFGQILGPRFLALFPNGCVNVHASLLPRWRGAAPIQRAIMAGDTESGVCLQVVVQELDAGDLIGERKVALSEATDAIILHDQLSHLGAELLANDFKAYLRGERQPVPQDPALVTYAAKINKSESELNWSQPAFAVSCHIRGLAMGPQAWTWLGSKKLKIHKVRSLPAVQHSQEPGTVIELSGNAFTVACAAGGLEVFEVQPESRPRMSVDAFLRGYKLQEGDRLGVFSDRTEHSIG